MCTLSISAVSCFVFYYAVKLTTIYIHYFIFFSVEIMTIVILMYMYVFNLFCIVHCVEPQGRHFESSCISSIGLSSSPVNKHLCIRSPSRFWIYFFFLLCFCFLLLSDEILDAWAFSFLSLDRLRKWVWDSDLQNCKSSMSQKHHSPDCDRCTRPSSFRPHSCCHQ